MTESAASRRMSRRAVLAGAGIAAAGVAGVARASTPIGEATGFYGPHQAGIVTPAPGFLSMAGFDLVTRASGDLAALLRTWTSTAARLTADGADRLTITFGLGPGLFSDERLGLADRRPDALTPLPSFSGEALDPGASGGDLCVQACASTPTAAHLAVRALVRDGRPRSALRWRQNGFRDVDGTADPSGLFGFRDGTSNLDVRDDGATAANLWVGDGPLWMHGGTYLVVRRIRLLLDTWDRTEVAVQEAFIGRRRDSNARFAAGATAHVRLAAPAGDPRETMLRRGYSYDAGVDPNGLLDAGLIFICFQRDPARQFVPVQRRLAAHDALNEFSQHRASALFACPPGCGEGSWIGEELFS